MWRNDAKFGMMIHWGPYSVLAGEWKGQRMDYIGEWIMSRFRIPISEYEQVARQFDISDFDADALVCAAKNAGMRYIIYTAKHHDGFAMYNSRCDGYNIVEMSPAHIDPLALLRSACDKYGVELCLYYSQSLDWHERDAGGSDTPGNYGMTWCNSWGFPDMSQKNFESYFRKKVLPQVTELLTGYGRIPLIWFDCPATITKEQGQELYDLVKRLQPGILVNSRIGNGLGDYMTLGDNQIPSGKLHGNFESVTTLNDTWGYKYFDSNWKNARTVIETLIKLVSKGVNYVVNFGPDGRGALPQACWDILSEVGGWMNKNGEAIYGVSPSPYDYDLEFGYAVTKGSCAYLFVRTDRPITLCGVAQAPKDVRILGGDALPWSHDGGKLCISGLPEPALMTVVRVEFPGVPQIDGALSTRGDGSIQLPASMGVLTQPQDEERVRAGSHRGTDAMPEQLSNRARVIPAGMTANWFDTDITLSWHFTTDSAGEYDVVLDTGTQRHGAPWQGGHSLYIKANDSPAISFTVVPDEKNPEPESRYYASCLTHCGRISLPRGANSLTLGAHEILSNDNRGLNVRSLLLIPCK